ncbi:hypothetical protein ACSSS7_005310 [Eimeria intestinalis]
MATSLLFQALQERGSARLRELQAAISSGDTIPLGESHGSCCRLCCIASDRVHTASEPKTSDAGETCVAHCIKSLSFKLAAPSAPHPTYIPSKYRKPSTSRRAPINQGFKGGCNPTSLEGESTGGGILAIDSASLAFATYPRLATHLCGLGQEISTPLWLLSHEQKERNHSASARGVVWVELWWVHPSEALSSQLRLWGNAALSRGHTAAAETLYTAALALLPCCEDTARSQAVLHANKSLASLRLGKVTAALRSATEAAAADPTYKKAWHRRASALNCLRDLVRRHCAQFRTFEGGATLTEVAQACPRLVDLELTDAQRLSQNDVTAAEAAAAAQRMGIGTCGCGRSSASSSQLEPPPSSSPRLWLREDVRVVQTAKGRGLVCDQRPKKALKKDPCLVLEEEAFALYVHPRQCAKVPKLPFSKVGLSLRQCSSTPLMQLHGDSAVRLAWEKECEAVAKEESEGSLPAEAAQDLEYFVSGAQGVCAGCAAVPAREEAAASGGLHWSGEARHALLHQLIRPTLSTVPCGSCAGALFCCNACRAHSSHKRVCQQQNQQRQKREDSVHKALQQQNAPIGNAAYDEGGAGGGFELGRLVRPSALAVQDPHRHIARQLINSLVPHASIPAIETQKETLMLGSTTLMPTNARCGDELFDEPAWQQILKMSATVPLDSTRLTDWLLNAACIASEAYLNGHGRQCGGRCLLCNFANAGGPVPSSLLHSTSSLAGSVKAAEQSTVEAVEAPAVTQTCKNCCTCCRAWCVRCSNALSSLSSTACKSSSSDFFPRCLYAAALHAYGVACCNSFTIRVLCDPEEDAVAAGTAFYLAASLMNHSCAPNAIALFGEPSSQRQEQQHQVAPTWRPQTSIGKTPLPAFRSGVGRGAQIQIRLCEPGNHAADDSNDSNTKEICISYGPLVGLENGSWGCRQEWLLRNAGFHCQCETCSSSVAESASSDAGTIAFEHEFFYGIPCPICTAMPRSQQLLGCPEQSDAEASGEDMLSRAVGLMRDLLTPAQEGSTTPGCRQQQQDSPVEETRSSIYLRLPAKTMQLVTSLAHPAFREHLSSEQGRHRTTTKALALLGHSCMALWSHACSPCFKASPIVPSFLSTKQPLYVCDEFQCIHCGFLLPAKAFEKARRAFQSGLDRLRSALSRIPAPSPIGDHQESCARALEEIVQTIPSAVAAGGLFSVFVWQALQAAARTAYLLGCHSADAGKPASSARSAAACLLAGVNVLVQRFPLGSAQPELYTHMYKAALLCNQAGDAAQAERLATSALKYTASSCGPLSVIHSSIQDLQRSMQLDHS